MIFQSTNEEGILKADEMARLPIGTKVITRREIKPTDKCVNCPYIFQDHFGIGEVGCRDENGAKNGMRFFPAKYAIGKEKTIQRKRTGRSIKICRHGYDSPLNTLPHIKTNPEEHYCLFKPVLYKITGGIWHTDWRLNIAKKVDLVSVDVVKQAKEILEKEAKLELFKTLKGWENWYPEHKIDINKTWRIEMEKIQ